MPQESRRSIGFRPFITCDDPRGVVECGTIRKPKTNPTQKGEYDQRYEPHRRKHKDLRQKADKGVLDNELEMEKQGFVCTRDAMQETRYHGLRLSGSSKDSFEESKRVIRDGVGRKGVLSEPSSEEASDDRQLLDSSDLPSTSSSRSSTVFSGNFVSPESFLSSASSSQMKKKNKKERRLNLIAKLMGVEDAFLRSFPYNSRKNSGKGEKIANQKKPAFDHDSPRARKHENEPQRSGSRRMKIEQLIEAVKFKGLHKSSRLCGAKPFSDLKHTEFPYLKDKWDCIDSDDRRPPIVIIKPVRFSCLKSEQPIIPKSRAQVDEEMLLKMRMRNYTLAQTDESETLDFEESSWKEREDQVPYKNPSRRKRYGDSIILKEKAKVKDFKGNETASSLGKSRPHKVNGSRRKRSTKSESHLHSYDGDKLAILKLESSRGSNNAKLDILGSAAFENRRQGSKRIAEDASEVEITDYVNNDLSFPSETPLLSSIRKNGSQCSTSGYKDTGKGSTAKKSLIALFLSSPTFINRVEELFKLKVNSKIHKDVHSDLSARVLLDCANELIERTHETHKTSSITYFYTSLDQLLVEVCDGIEALSSYREAHGEVHSIDGPLLLVKGDLRRGMLGGVWDLGWECLGSAVVVEEITRRVDELVFGGLIEEILVDLTL